MPTQTLLPDALLAHAEWAGSPVVATIDEDPDTAGGDWLDPADVATSSPTARVGFPTPTGPPSGVQTFKARLGLSDALGMSPTVRIDLYEAGVLKASGAAQTITSTKLLAGQVISQTFDLATTPLTTANGSGVEALVVVTASGGKPADRRSASLDSVNWDIVNYTVPDTTPPASGGTYRDVVLADAPVAYYRLGEASGTTAADEMAVQAGTYVNAPTLAEPGLLTGDADTAVTFDGTTQHVNVGDLKAGSLPDATVELWFKATTTATVQYMYVDGYTASTLPLFGVVLHAGLVRAFWRNDAGVTLDLRSPLTYNDGVRHRVDVTRVGTTVRIYVDGGEVATGTTPGGAITLDMSTIAAARRGTSTDMWFTGTLDEVAVYNYALTAAKVLEHYQAGTTATSDTTPPVTTLGTPTRTTISRVPGWDASEVAISTNEAFVEYQIRRVPAETSTRTEGALIETAVVAATTSLTATITDDELVAAGGAEGQNTVKCWTRDSAGNWSTN